MTIVTIIFQLSGVGTANKPLPGTSKADADTADIEARLRQLHS